MQRRNKFSTQDWWNPTTWFGQPSVPPPPFTGVSQVYPDYSKSPPNSFKTSTGSSLESSLKSNFTEPFTNTESAVVSDVSTVWKDALSVGRTT